MLKRARTSLGIASSAALFGFTGILDSAAPVARAAFYVLLAFSGLSLLLSLFEETETSAIRVIENASEATSTGCYQLVLDFGF